MNQGSPSTQPMPMPPSRRLFFALPISENVRDTCAETATAMAKAANFTPAEINWVNPENYHLTLHFLGSVPEPQFQALATQLPSFAARFQAFPLDFQGIGYFPHPRAPRVLWIGVRACPPILQGIVQSLGELIKETGLSLRHENFHAHLTVARFKSLKGTAAFVKQASLYKSKTFGRSQMERIHLMESKLGDAGSTYMVRAKGSLIRD